MLKMFLILLCLLFLPSALTAAEEAAAPNEHGGETHKPPPKPLSGSPIGAVLKLPVVAGWREWMKQDKGSLTGWGENINTIEGHKCWIVAIGETKMDGAHFWRRFCVPADGTDIWVQKTSPKPGAEISYLTYDDWVKQCQPATDGGGIC